MPAVTLGPSSCLCELHSAGVSAWKYAPSLLAEEFAGASFAVVACCRPVDLDQQTGAECPKAEVLGGEAPRADEGDPGTAHHCRHQAGQRALQGARRRGAAGLTGFAGPTLRPDAYGRVGAC